MLRKRIDRNTALGDRPRPGTPPAGDPARGVIRYHDGDDPEHGVSEQWWWRTVDVALADDPAGEPDRRSTASTTAPTC